MTRTFAFAALLAIFSFPAGASAADPQLSHVVYFKLKESTPTNQEKLVNACRTFLSGHEGAVYFATGVLAADMSREVNDKDFDVSLIVVFRNKAAHDLYQQHPRHLQFIAEYGELWSGVRVCDSYLAPAEPARDVPAARIPLPDAAASFAGLVRGVVVKQLDRGIVIEVSEVLREWKQSGASKGEALKGKSVLVVSGDNPNARKLLRLLKQGETVTLDVAHKSGEALTILELTEEQRQRIK